MSAGRALPSAIDAEKGLLGCVLMAPQVIDEFPDLPMEAFHSSAHMQIFIAMREMAATSRPIDLITVTQRLEDLGILGEVGGAAYITDLSLFVPTAGNAKYYAEVLREKWVRRRLIDIAIKLNALGYDEPDATIEDLLSEAERLIIELRTQTETGRVETVRHCSDAVMEAIDHIELVNRTKGGVIGLESGLHDLDRMTGGWRAAQMVVIGGRPGDGKSTLLMQACMHVVDQLAKPALCFTSEMSAKELMVRQICSDSRVDIQRSRDGFFSKLEVSKITSSAIKMEKVPLYIDDSTGLTTAQLRSRARRAKLKHKIELIVIDYLQLLEGVSKRGKENRQLEIAEISVTIKQLAKELNIPIIVAAQVGRTAEERKHQRPKKKDLRESAAIEQDADLIILIYRLEDDEVEKQEEENGKLKQQGQKPKPIHDAELILAKQRNGPVGTVKVRFLKQYTLFENLTPKMFSNNPEERQQ